MEKLKTLNNRYAFDFIRYLYFGDFRSCCYMLYNGHESFTYEPFAKLVCRFFSYLGIIDNFLLRELCDFYSIDVCVSNYIIKLFHEWKGGVYDDNER